MATQNPVEMCLIDAGLKSLKHLKLPENLIYLNVYCNQIEKIDSISHLIELRHLDLSSNQITKMIGFSGCRSLQTLNLSCNCISKVEGLDYLKNLKNLNISYNQLHDLSGLKVATKRTHNLTHVQLHGNKLSSLKHLIQCLSNCNCISFLYLQCGNDGNPVCEIPAYRPNMLAQMPWLHSLDGRDRYGNIIDDDVSLHDIPGLDEFLGLLEPSSLLLTVSSVSSSEENNPVNTVGVQQVPVDTDDYGAHRVAVNTDGAHRVNVNTDGAHQVPVNTDVEHQVTDRLESLENKMGSLVQLFIDNMKDKEKRENKERDKEQKEYNFDSESSSEEMKSSNDELIELPQSMEVKQNKEVKPARMKQQLQSKPSVQRLKGEREISRANLIVDGKRSKLSEKPANKAPTKCLRTTADDETYLTLLNEMDAERERRWKAERASRKLVESIKMLQEKLIEERKIQEVTISSSVKMKKSLQVERESRQQFEKLSNELKHENCSMKTQLDELLMIKEVSKKSIEELEAAKQRLAKEKFDEGIFNEKRYEELQLETGGCHRELELLKNTANKQKDQISQLQDLIISREQEQKNLLAKMVSVDSKEVRELIDREVAKFEASNAELIKHHMQRLAESKNDYSALEDEFRQALQIEANRYNEVYASYESTVEELNVLKGSFENTCQKEAKSRALVLELSSLVKEQKARISEITKSQSEMQLQYKERVEKLEKEVSGLRDVCVKVESLQVDKDRMSAHIRGQESVIQGLRSERKLWGQELAQQGASLAQDKGKMDIQLASQREEIIHLKNQLKDNLDSLKIKCKLIEDQTETIRITKQELLKVSEGNKKLDNDARIEREALEDELGQARDMNQELQEAVDALTDRKQELKSKLASMDEELKQSKDELKSIHGQWDERSKMIDQFEEKVVRMKNTFDEERKKLNDEKMIAVDNATALEEKWNSFQVQHKSEIAAMKHNYNLELKKISVQKDEEVAKYKQQVMQVEEEMRLLLNETTNQKKNLESRINQLSKAFSDIQRDLT